MDFSRELAAAAQREEPLPEVALQSDAGLAALAQVRRAQSEFLCALGHELRSPLTAILGFAQLMDAGEPTSTPRQQSNLAQILKAGWDLRALIDELLDPSLIECGQVQLQMERVSLADVLRDCESLVEPLARQSDVSVVFAWPEQPLFVAADRARLRQILMTLLGHALLHSGAEGTVRLSCVRCAAGRVRVHFQDTSCGQSAAWLVNGDAAKHIKLIVSQQLAGHMGGVVATEFIAGAAGDASAYWLELNAAGDSP